MRLDYVLYGLGVVFFGLSAVSFVIFAQDSQLLYVVSTAVLGVLSVGAGLAQRPTAVSAPAAPVIKSAEEAPIEQAVVEASAEPAVTEQIVQEPETATVDAVAATAPAIEEPKPVAEPTEQTAESTGDVKSETPLTVTTEPKIELTTATEAPAEPTVEPQPTAQTTPAAIAPQPVVSTVATAPAEAQPSALTQIRGISQKRAEQLQANGVNTIQELANASADDLAAKLGVSPKIVKMWIGSAKKASK